MIETSRLPKLTTEDYYNFVDDKKVKRLSVNKLMREKLASGWNDPSRGTREQRGYDSAWRRVRPKILKRDGYRCRCDDCKRLGRVLSAGEVDHRIPKFEGGTDDPSNLYAINRDCHKRKTQAEALRARAVQ